MTSDFKALVASCAVALISTGILVVASKLTVIDCAPTEICKPFTHTHGYGYAIGLMRAYYKPDQSNALTSTVEVFEDGKPLGPAHSNVGEIENLGSGRFIYFESSLNFTLYFSASDNSDPNTNGRTYTVNDPRAIDPYLPK